mmetsp:Transcript_14723/g.28809  ORF Transcript_14723/g.28809 Transcript_14723/m.28809 type:complete len:234 (-) Transcript_14723:860-1561(-)
MALLQTGRTKHSLSATCSSRHCVPASGRRFLAAALCTDVFNTQPLTQLAPAVAHPQAQSALALLCALPGVEHLGVVPASRRVGAWVDCLNLDRLAEQLRRQRRDGHHTHARERHARNRRVDVKLNERVPLLHRADDSAVGRRGAAALASPSDAHRVVLFRKPRRSSGCIGTHSVDTKAALRTEPFVVGNRVHSRRQTLHVVAIVTLVAEEHLVCTLGTVADLAGNVRERRVGD